MRKRYIKPTLFLAAWLMPPHAVCAALAMQISNLSDLNLPTWNIGDPAISAHIDICIYSAGNTPSASYAITISSPGGYKLTSGANNIPYSLYWEDAGYGNLGSSAGAQLSNGVKLSSRSNANTVVPLCALTGPNARLNLKITQADMAAALAGTYTGTITLLLSPN